MRSLFNYQNVNKVYIKALFKSSNLICNFIIKGIIPSKSTHSPIVQHWAVGKYENLVSVYFSSALSVYSQVHKFSLCYTTSFVLHKYSTTWQLQATDYRLQGYKLIHSLSEHHPSLASLWYTWDKQKYFLYWLKSYYERCITVVDCLNYLWKPATHELQPVFRW